MKEIYEFITSVGKLKSEGRRGWKIHDIENPETTAAHTFQLALIVWTVGKRKEDFDLNRAIKMALIHDICEVHSPDLTSYDAVGIDENEKFTRDDIENLKPKKGRPTLKQRKKMKKVKRELESEAMDKILADLPEEISEDFFELWREYEKKVTPEAKFVKQADDVTNLLQGMEYWKDGHKGIEYRLWVRRGKEKIDDPDLIEFLVMIEESL